jgi:hypothetical protein
VGSRRARWEFLHQQCSHRHPHARRVIQPQRTTLLSHTGGVASINKLTILNVDTFRGENHDVISWRSHHHATRSNTSRGKFEATQDDLCKEGPQQLGPRRQHDKLMDFGVGGKAGHALFRLPNWTPRGIGTSRLSTCSARAVHGSKSSTHHRTVKRAI